MVVPVTDLIIKDIRFMDIRNNTDVPVDESLEGRHVMLLLVEQKVRRRFLSNDKVPRTLVYRNNTFNICGKQLLVGDTITIRIGDAGQQLLSISSPRTSCIIHTGLDTSPDDTIIEYLGEFDHTTNIIDVSSPEYRL